MSMNAYNVALPYFFLAVLAAMVLSPTDDPQAQVVFLIGMAVALVVFVVWLPRADGPGGSLCCGFLVAAPLGWLLAYQVGWGGPLAKALAAPVALTVGPLTELTLQVVADWGEARRTRRGIALAAAATRLPELLGPLLDTSAIREAALERLDELEPTPEGAAELIRGLLSTRGAGFGAEWEDYRADLVARALKANPKPEELLAIYGDGLGSNIGAPATERLVEALTSNPQVGVGDLLAAAHRRLTTPGGFVDGVVLHLLDVDRPKGVELARKGLVAGSLTDRGVKALGAEDAQTVLEAALDARELGEGSVSANTVVAASVELPAVFSMPLLARLLSWKGQAPDSILFWDHLRERKGRLFPGAHKAPDAARALLEVVEEQVQASTPGKIDHDKWTALADEIRLGLKEP